MWVCGAQAPHDSRPETKVNNQLPQNFKRKLPTKSVEGGKGPHAIQMN